MRIRSLLNEEVMSGFHEVRWDGKDKEGSDVPSGIYLAQLAVGSNIQTRKMILVR